MRQQCAMDDRDRHPTAVVEAETGCARRRKQHPQQRLIGNDRGPTVVHAECPRHLRGRPESLEAVRPRLLDGVIRSVTPQGIVIMQEVNDPLSLVKQREVRKGLRTSEDGK